MRGFQSEWVENIKEAGKFSFVHMDGTLAGLLRQQASVGFTVLEALTPHPVGDIRIEDFKRWMGDSESIAWGGIPGSYFTANVSDNEFDRHVKHVLSVMITKPKYVLGVADQVPPDALERRVRRWQNSSKSTESTEPNSRALLGERARSATVPSRCIYRRGTAFTAATDR